MRHEYDVVMGERRLDGIMSEFAHDVENYLNDGWELQGGIAIDSETGYVYQAVYRKIDD